MLSTKYHFVFLAPLCNFMKETGFYAHDTEPTTHGRRELMGGERKAFLDGETACGKAGWEVQDMGSYKTSECYQGVISEMACVRRCGDVHRACQAMAAASCHPSGL